MDKLAFERDRLALFRNAGFEGRSAWFEDSTLGITTYGIVGQGKAPRGDACPTILIHGGIAGGSVWYAMAPHLQGPVIILDRPGHGLSSDMDYTGVDYRAHAVAWLTGVINKIGPGPVNLVGNSMGGYFAMAFAVAHPHRVRHLSLVGAPAGLDRVLPLFLRAWLRPIMSAVLTVMIGKTRTPEQMRTRVMKNLVAHPERVSDEALRLALIAATRPKWHPAMLSMLRSVTDANGWRSAMSMRKPMITLTVPTLFAWGDRDSFAPPSSGQALAARMPFARVEVLADAGHLPQLDSPAEIAAMVNRFNAELAIPAHAMPTSFVRA